MKFYKKSIPIRIVILLLAGTALFSSCNNQVKTGMLDPYRGSGKYEFTGLFKCGIPELFPGSKYQLHSIRANLHHTKYLRKIFTQHVHLRFPMMEDLCYSPHSKNRMNHGRYGK